MTRKLWSGFAAMILATVVASAAVAQYQAPQQAGGKPGGVVTEVVVVKATVEAIDYKTRTVTLKGPQGNTMTFKVDKSVKNFDQVKQGDQLVLEVYDSVALFVRKGGEPPIAAQMGLVEVAPRGKKPAGVVVETTEITASVEAIDYKARTVTLKGPQGNVRTIKVDPSVKNFDNVKKGDQIVLRHTEAVVVSVQKQ